MDKMAHIIQKQRCQYEGMTYSDGTGLCVAGQCMICQDGDWKEDDTIGLNPRTS